MSWCIYSPKKSQAACTSAQQSLVAAEELFVDSGDEGAEESSFSSRGGGEADVLYVIYSCLYKYFEESIPAISCCFFFFCFRLGVGVVYFCRW